MSDPDFVGFPGNPVDEAPPANPDAYVPPYNEDQPPPHKPTDIKGYRNLSPDELVLINTVKQQEADVLDYLGHLNNHANPERKRMLALAKTNLQQGFMWAVRALSAPECQ